MSDAPPSPPDGQGGPGGSGHTPAVFARIAELEARLARLERSRDRWRAAALDFASRLDLDVRPDIDPLANPERYQP